MSDPIPLRKDTGKSREELQAEAIRQVDDIIASDRPDGGLDWPVDELTDAFGPLVAGRAYGFGGRPGNGKSSLMRAFIKRYVDEGREGIVFGTEMKPGATITALAAAYCGIEEDVLHRNEWQKFRTERELEYKRVRGMAREITNSGVIFPECLDLDTTQIETTVRQAFTDAIAYGRRPEFVIVDHIHRMVGQGDDGQVVGNAVKFLSDLAQNEGLVVLIACQIARPVGKRALDLYIPPTLSSWANSSKIEQNLWQGFGLYRPLKPGLKAKDEKKIERGEMDVEDFAIAGTMGIGCVKSRSKGELAGRRVWLAVKNGRVEKWSEKPEPDFFDDGTGEDDALPF